MKSPAIKLLIIAAIMFLLSGGVAAFLVREQEAKGSILKDQMKSVKDHAELQQRHSALEADWNSSVSPREVMRSFVLEGERGTIDLLAKLDEIASQEGVVINTTALNVENTPEGGFNDLVGNFTLRGESRAVERVVRQLELLPYGISLGQFKLTRANDQSEVTLVLRVSVFE